MLFRLVLEFKAKKTVINHSVSFISLLNFLQKYSEPIPLAFFCWRDSAGRVDTCHRTVCVAHTLGRDGRVLQNLRSPARICMLCSAYGYVHRSPYCCTASRGDTVLFSYTVAYIHNRILSTHDQIINLFGDLLPLHTI